MSPTPAVVPAGAAPQAGRAAESPLGFLAAIAEQVLDRPPPDAESPAASSTPGTSGLAFGQSTSLVGDIEPHSPLPAALDAIDAGAPGGLAGLQEALNALLGRANGPFETPPGLAGSEAATAPDLVDQLAALSADPTTEAPDGLTLSEIVRALFGYGAPATVQALADLGVATGARGVPADPLRLYAQLNQSAAGLSASSPELARQLEALASRLAAADADPDLFGKLAAGATKADETLDHLVQSLIGAGTARSVAATPQIGTPRDLALPAPLSPEKSEVATPPSVQPHAVADKQPASAPAISITARETAPDAPPEARGAAGGSSTATDAVPPQPATPLAPASAQAQVRALPAAYQPVANPINMGQVAFEMALQVQQGASRFTIRLDPPELGRIDVKLQVDSAGAVNARLTVDRAETLDLFQRDRQQLERALAQAGLDSSRTSIEFSLRQQSHNPFAGMMGDQRQQQPGHGAARSGSASVDDAGALPTITLHRGIASAGGVNIFA